MPSLREDAALSNRLKRRMCACAFACVRTCVCSAYSGYIGEFEIVDDHRAGKIVIEVRASAEKQ